MIKKAITKTRQLLGLLKTEAIHDRAELSAVATRVAILQMKRDALTIEMDAELQAVRDKFGPQIDTLGGECDHEVKRIKSWAITHREAEFGGRQSIVISGHEFAFRKGTGSVEMLGKEAEIVDTILAADGPRAEELQEQLIRIKPSLNKDAVLIAWRTHGHELPDDIAAFGLGVAVEETFTFTPARTELPDSAQTSAVESEAA